jgi:hypothetical protein
MLSKKLFTMGTLLTLLLGTTLFAQEHNCANGVCFVSLDQPISKKTFQEKQKKVDKTIDIIVDADEIIVFSSYKMAKDEYYLTEEEMQAEILTEELVDQEKQINEILIVEDLSVLSLYPRELH